jgi:hypothetical protein
MKRHRRRHHRRAAALALLACAALAAPAGALADTPADYPGMPGAPAAPAPKIGDTPADYPGMPGASAHSEPADEASTPALEAGGLDWSSAAIGAAGAGLLIVVSLGGASVLSRRRMRVAR